MLLRNLHTIVGDIVDILVQNDKIDGIGVFPEDHNGQVINFDNAIVFPGLINSHDHLDFNLFPRLGNKLYSNYVEWSHDIQNRNKDIINDVLKIPKKLRVEWGIYKNLVCGITTVVNHGERLATTNNLISVIQNCYSLHSVRLEKHWKLKLNMPFVKKWPFVIHVGEGSNIETCNEIDKLIKWNLYNRDIIGIHGIAMSEPQAANFKALVWCPDSNYFLIGRSAPVQRLKYITDIVFGTDSTLTAGWNIWEQLRFARNENEVSDDELYNMVTITPSKVWKVPACGKLESACDADIVIARDENGLSGYDAYYALNPEDILMVIHKGNIRLFDAGFLPQLAGSPKDVENFSKININGNCKYVFGDLPALMNQIKSYCPRLRFPFENNS